MTETTRYKDARLVCLPVNGMRLAIGLWLIEAGMRIARLRFYIGEPIE